MRFISLLILCFPVALPVGPDSPTYRRVFVLCFLLLSEVTEKALQVRESKDTVSVPNNYTRLSSWATLPLNGYGNNGRKDVVRKDKVPSM